MIDMLVDGFGNRGAGGDGRIGTFKSAKGS